MTIEQVDSGVASTGADAPVTDTPSGDTPSGDSSMEATIRETYRNLKETGVADEPGEAGQPTPPAAKPGEAARTPTGQFAKKPPDGAAPVPGQDPAQDPNAPTTKPHDAYPSSWKKTDKALTDSWAALPENVREEIHRREGDMLKGLGQYRDAAGFGQGIASEMMPYSPQIKASGIAPRDIVKMALRDWSTLATGTPEAKAGLLLKLATDYGIPLDTVESLRQRAPSQVAPEADAVAQRVARLETHVSAQQSEREQLQREQDEASVRQFMADPAHEHASTVWKEMSALLKSGEAVDLKDAYNKAIWLNPQAREAILAKQREEETRKAAETAAAARRAAATNVNRRGTPPTQAKAGTMDDTIRSEYRRLTNAG